MKDKFGPYEIRKWVRGKLALALQIRIAKSRYKKKLVGCANPKTFFYLVRIAINITAPLSGGFFF